MQHFSTSKRIPIDTDAEFWDSSSDAETTASEPIQMIAKNEKEARFLAEVLNVEYDELSWPLSKQPIGRPDLCEEKQLYQ